VVHVFAHTILPPSLTPRHICTHTVQQLGLAARICDQQLHLPQARIGAFPHRTYLGHLHVYHQHCPAAPAIVGSPQTPANCTAAQTSSKDVDLQIQTVMVTATQRDNLTWDCIYLVHCGHTRTPQFRSPALSMHFASRTPRDMNPFAQTADCKFKAGGQNDSPKSISPRILLKSQGQYQQFTIPDRLQFHNNNSKNKVSSSTPLSLRFTSRERHPMTCNVYCHTFKLGPLFAFAKFIP
jgi:hypothetical protein